MDDLRINDASGFTRFRYRLPYIAAVFTGVFMLCFIPLLFNDAFFDINRVKVNMVIQVIPVLCMIMGLFVLIMPRKGAAFSGVPWWCIIPMLLLLCAYIVSCALQGFSEAVLLGNEGRYGGLYFVLSLIGAFFILILGRLKGNAVLYLSIAVSVGIAALGILNALGIDPLHFYDEIREDQITVFMSTIGHYDFYGTFLLLPTAAAYMICIKAEYGGTRFLAGVAALVLTCGAFAARTDSVWVGMVIIAYALFFLSGESLSRMAFALIMDAALIMMCPVTVYALTKYSTLPLDFSGFYVVMNLQTAGECAAVLFLFAVICITLQRNGKKAPGFKKLAYCGLLVFIALAAVAVFLMVYVTVINPEATLFGIADRIRMDDEFGTRRGYIWIRGFRAFLDASPLYKLFGQGLEMAKIITRPYIENAAEEQLSGGIYNDVHNQALQILLTCGIVGLAGFVGHYIVSFLAVLNQGENNAVASALAAALAGYLVVMIFNVSQPILLVQFFCVSGLAISHVFRRENEQDYDKERAEYAPF